MTILFFPRFKNVGALGLFREEVGRAKAGQQAAMGNGRFPPGRSAWEMQLESGIPRATASRADGSRSLLAGRAALLTLVFYFQLVFLTSRTR